MGESNLQKCGTVSRYHRGRSELIRLAGGKCVGCGKEYDLQFHHTEQRTWVANKTSRWVRLARYKREYKLGQVVLLCADCNKRNGKPHWR